MRGNISYCGFLMPQRNTSLSSYLSFSILVTSLFLISPLPVAASSNNQVLDANPLHVFIQPGIAVGAHALTLGVTYDWDSEWKTAIGPVKGYWEVAGGYWRNRDKAADNVRQFGITPVVRLYPNAWSNGWYVEGGIGANMLTPRYASGDKKFSTKFNFGDQLAIGKQFGSNAAHEISLRWEHFSNGGIKQPNPGENFLQVRYAAKW
ncbi:MAG: acyloxyacyl hydrolase [Pseudomonadota bacterium]